MSDRRESPGFSRGEEVKGTPFAVAAATSTTPPSSGGGTGGTPTPTAAVPTVTLISPNTGPAAGGTVVTIIGTNLIAPLQVNFGSIPGTAVVVQTASQIQVTSPPGSGTVPVTVTDAAGTSASNSAAQFSYQSPAPPHAPVAFPDVPASFWAYPYIELLAAKGIVSGFPDGTFQPNAPVTRAQFVKMLVLTLGLKPGNGATAFTDVTPTDWFAPYVSAAVSAGIVSGLTPTTFGPNQPLTREQMAVLLARALKLSTVAPLHFTDDAQIAPWAVTAVGQAVAAGYISGFPNGTFQPLGTTTRAQAAKVLAIAAGASTSTGAD